MEDAEKCRKNGWTVGAILEGDEGYGPERIQITAIGERNILARQVAKGGKSYEDRERSWTLSCRDWKQVGFCTSDRYSSPLESARSALTVIMNDVCGQLQFGGDPAKCMRRIGRVVGCGFAGTDSNAAHAWLEQYLARNECPADLLEGET